MPRSNSPKHKQSPSTSSKKQNQSSWQHPNQSNTQSPNKFKPSLDARRSSTDSMDVVLPDQRNKFYLSISISPSWMDSKLIPDLVRHISQFTGRHIVDAYIANRSRLGFFTASNLQIAERFVNKAETNSIKCWTRTVSAEIVPLPKNTNFHRVQNGVRVRIANVNNVMGRRDFEFWCRKMTQTQKKTHLIYDIEIVFPKISRGSSQCILLFDTEEDIKYVKKRMQNRKFRGMPLKFEQWYHPHSDNKPSTATKVMQRRQINNNVNMNVIKPSSVKPQKNIWAQMATQRKQQRVQPQSPAKTVSKSEIIEIEQSLMLEMNENKDNVDTLQPTKPPQKVHASPKSHETVTTSSFSSDDNRIMGARKMNVYDNNKPRIPPLTNQYRPPSSQPSNGVNADQSVQEHKIDQNEIGQIEEIKEETLESMPTPTQESKQNEAIQGGIPEQMPQTPQQIQQSALNQLLQHIQSLPPQQQIQLYPVYLQQLQLQQQLQHAQQAPIRMVNINQMQQLQQLQQQQQHPQAQHHQTPMPIHPQNMQYHNMQYQHPYNLSMQPYISQMPPPPSSFQNVHIQQNQQTPNERNDRTQHHQYRTPPRHHRQNHGQQSQPQPQPQQQQQKPVEQNNYENDNSKIRKALPQKPVQQQSNSKNQQQQSESNRSKSVDHLDKLCKYCLLSDHEPSKCVWFNPNIKSNKH